MRIAHLADPHVTEGARLADQAATLAAVVDDILAAEPDLILVAGDLYGHEVPHRSTPRERAVLYPAIVRLASQAPVVVVVGNHDVAEDVAGVQHLGGAWPIVVVADARAITVDTLAGPCHVYAMAYPTKRALLAGEAIEGGMAGAQRAIEERLRVLLAMWGHRMRTRRAAAPAEAHVVLAHVQVSGCRTSGGEVLAGQEIELTRHELDGLPADYIALGHIHLRQEVAVRAWYPGSPWRNDFGEKDVKGWHLVHVGPVDVARAHAPLGEGAYPAVPGERAAVYVEHHASPCRDFVTLHYRWAADHDEGVPRWITRPTDAEIASCAGAEVKLVLVVPEQWVSGCPWADEVARVEALAHRVKQERKIEPRLRMRAPEVAAAIDAPTKMRAFWGTLATAPDANEQAAAIDALAEIDTRTDEEIAADSLAACGSAA